MATGDEARVARRSEKAWDRVLVGPAASGAKRSITKHGRPLTGRAMSKASRAVSPVRATSPPSLRSKRRDHGPIERETLFCGALDYGNERRSRAFLVR